MGPTYREPSTWDTRMEVGPSAAPIIPMEVGQSFQIKAHECGSADGKENTELGGCSEEEHNGWERSGPKSIMAPIPINSKMGSASDASIPTLNSHSIIPFTSPIPALSD